MSTSHVVVESCLALVVTGTLGTLEVGRLARAAKIVILHTTDTATLELATLREQTEGR